MFGLSGVGVDLQKILSQERNKKQVTREAGEGTGEWRWSIFHIHFVFWDDDEKAVLRKDADSWQRFFIEFFLTGSN